MLSVKHVSGAVARRSVSRDACRHVITNTVSYGWGAEAGYRGTEQQRWNVYEVEWKWVRTEGKGREGGRKEGRGGERARNLGREINGKTAVNKVKEREYSRTELQRDEMSPRWKGNGWERKERDGRELERKGEEKNPGVVGKEMKGNSTINKGNRQD